MAWALTMGVVLVITGAAAFFVAWPLLVGRTRPEEFFDAEEPESALERLLFQRDTTYAAIKELEFDRAMGNLPEEEFEQLRARYEDKAETILKWIDDARAGKLSARVLRELEDGFEVEEQVSAERHVAGRGGPRIDLDVEQEIEDFRRRNRERAASRSDRAPGPAAGSVICPSCGRPARDSDASFCSKCGAALRQPSSKRRKGPGNVKGDR